MRVAELQQYLSDLSRLLCSTDAKKSGSELARIAEGLGPFREYDLGAFGEFLAHAEEYRRTGKVPEVGKKPPVPSKPRVKPKVDLTPLRDAVVRSYNQASSPDVTFESIDELRLQLEPLTKPELLTMAEAIEYKAPKSKSKADVLEAIIARIKSVKQSSMRASVART